jgi:hypothetical protein
MTTHCLPHLKSLFQHRTLVIATMHQKEQAIAPLLQQAFDLVPMVPTDFDTDQFGTFTREIKRVSDAVATARLKAEQALLQTGESLAIASEGSFGPHPGLPFIPCNREIVLLLDQKHQLEIIGQAFSTETNYAHQVVKTKEEALTFAAKVRFPSHGLVAIANPKAAQSAGQNNELNLASQQIIKGITIEEQLQEVLTWAFEQAEVVHLETDMRALYNPQRMKVIAQATENLIQVIHQVCPQCGCPGFQVVERRRGLPCELCGAPTALLYAEMYRCKRCNHQVEKRFPNGQEFADPGQCEYCNP